MNRAWCAAIAAWSWSGRLCLAAIGISWLGACSQSDIAPGVDRHRIVDSGTSVTIIGAGDKSHAVPIAEQFCELYGKTAKFKRMNSRRLARYAFTQDAEF